MGGIIDRRQSKGKNTHKFGVIKCFGNDYI